MIEALFSALPFGDIQKKPTLISGGCSHLTYRVETDQGVYAAKALNKSVLNFLGGIELFKHRDELLALMIETGFPSVSAIHIDERVAIYPWREGRLLALDQVCDHHVKRVAQLLANVHQCPVTELNLPLAPWQWLPHTDWSELFADKTLLSQLKMYESLYRQSWESLSGQEALSHGDLNFTNVLWSDKNEPCVLDWESMGMAYPKAELISNAMGWSGYAIDNFNIKLYQTMLAEYQQASGTVLQLTENDFYASWGYWLIWLVFCQKRVLGLMSCSPDQKAFYQSSVQKTLCLMDRLSSAPLNVLLV